MTGTDDGAARSTGRIRRAARLAVAISAATGAISAAACHDPSGAPRGLERAPLEEWTVLQPFGAWNASRGGYHLATDLVAVPGTPVRTAGAGQVIFAQVEVEGYGAVVVVRHAGADPEVTTLYGHLSARRGPRFCVPEPAATFRGQR